MVRNLALLLLTLSLLGCSTAPPSDKPMELTGQVMSVWMGRCFQDCYYSIVFQDDNGNLYSVRYFGSAPPLWQGLRCRVRFSNYSVNFSTYRNIEVTRLDK